ncbi:Ribosomal protein arginine N-methyltransferase rmt3 [Leucoagaricus sp. SymC.cos]|nr:Ribosomal protein arginine N-methyltransferase rmt3 [Leucoagaricus sp. SymC.cos]
MSIILPPTKPSGIREPDVDAESVSSSSTGEDEDQNWDDWMSDSLGKQECPSLFEDTRLPSIHEAITFDREKHNFDLDNVCSRLGLDFHGRVRLINYIRKNKLASRDALALSGTESWLLSDEYLVPALEDDPLLQAGFAEDWSDEEEENGDIQDSNKKIRTLEKKLAVAQQSLLEYRQFMQRKLNLPTTKELASSVSTAPARDDDTHYFDSYAENDIHAVMIQDKVRTSTYAHFILTNPHLFRDATVLDVGCGTGILSLFAARSGAKRVIAVDASNITEKAEEICKANGFEDVITVVREKVENITLPDGIHQVDIIISEWMGYALLYESMLDSVLVARDRFLRPGGVMAPSQCQMMLALCDATEIYKDRIGFWNDVYGFDMSVMSQGLYDEAIVDVVGPETMASKPYVVKDLFLGDTTTRQLEFASNFTLKATVDKRTRINSFVLYFDTFFAPSGRPVPHETEVKFIQEGDAILADIWPVGGKPATKRRQSLGPDREEITSFSTGPQSKPTHWKQTLFMLPDPITVTEGSIVSGSFKLRKRETNSRELDVEIHYSVKRDAESVATETVVRMYRVQ